MEKQKARKVKSVQKYTFEIIHYEDDYSIMKRTNKGFSVVELLGIISIVQSDLMELMKQAVRLTDEINLFSTDSPIIHKKEF